MRTLIIGAGLSGLRVALDIEEALVLEKSQRIGGLLDIYPDLGIEKFYHHFFEFNTELIPLLKRLKLWRYVRWYETKTGFLVNGKIYPLNTPIEILRYPHLSITDKLRLALFVRECREMMKRREILEEMDEIDGNEWVKKKCGERLYQNFFQPLIESKFGKDANRISASWVIGRVGMRSSRGFRGERVGYLKGGFGKLVEALAEKSDAEILKGVRVKEVNFSGGFKEVRTSKGCFKGEHLIVTAPELVRNIKWQKTSCALVATEEPVLEEIYWLNVQGIPRIGAVIAHTNMVSPEEYGCHLTYFVSYTGELDERFVRKVLRDHFQIRDVKWIRIENANYTAPVYERGYLKNIAPYEEKGIYYAGLFSESNYPERSMEGSIIAGRKVAEMLGSERK